MKVNPGAERRRRLLRRVGQRVAPDERAERRRRHHAVDEGRHPGRRHVQIHDLDGLALLIVGRRGEGKPEPDDEQRRRRRREPRQHAARQVDEDRRVGEIQHEGAFYARRGQAMRVQCGERFAAPELSRRKVSSGQTNGAGIELSASEVKRGRGQGSFRRSAQGAAAPRGRRDAASRAGRRA